MLNRSNRLHDRKTINQIYRRGRQSSTSLLNIRWLPNNSANLRLVVVVPTKVSKKATLRNRIRRRVAGQIRQYIKLTKTGADVIISVRQDPGPESTEQLAQQLQTCFKHADLID